MLPTARRTARSPLPQALWGWLAVLALLVRLALPALHDHAHDHVHLPGATACAIPLSACACGFRHSEDGAKGGVSVREACGQAHACAACELESFAPVDRVAAGLLAVPAHRVVSVRLRIRCQAPDLPQVHDVAAPRAPPSVRPHSVAC
jgi:hypothetical protein